MFGGFGSRLSNVVTFDALNLGSLDTPILCHMIDVTKLNCAEFGFRTQADYFRQPGSDLGRNLREG
jgi:hypothetical protein